MGSLPRSRPLLSPGTVTLALVECGKSMPALNVSWRAIFYRSVLTQGLLGSVQGWQIKTRRPSRRKDLHIIEKIEPYYSR